MDWTTIQRNWTALVPRMLQRWPEADEARLLSFDGDRAALTGHLQERLSLDRAAAEEEVAAFAAGEMPADVVMDPRNDNANIAESHRMIPPGEVPLDDDTRFGDDEAGSPPLGRTG